MQLWQLGCMLESEELPGMGWQAHIDKCTVIADDAMPNAQQRVNARSK